MTLSQFQNSWAAEHAPVLTVRSGECVEVHASDASGGQVTRDSTTASLEGFDWGRACRPCGCWVKQSTGSGPSP